MSAQSIPDTEPTSSQRLAAALRVHPLIARVLVARGLDDAPRAQRFLHPKLADLTRPDAMADRALAVDRIDRAITANERIVVFGDYDVDGTTSAALLTLALRAMGADVVPHVASRFGGGYGFSETALAGVLESKPSLVITCDCGTSDHDRLASLRARGIDSIVVDHHHVPSAPLPATAFLNPHRAECGFAYKHLASVGLVLSLVAGVRAKRGVTLDLRTWLDLVAIGTIADVAPLDGDNRILVRAGLDRIAQGQVRPGIAALFREAKIRTPLRAFDVGFQVGPLLNAPGRLGAATPTLDLLLCDEPTRAVQIAQALVRANESRRKISEGLIAKALEQVSAVYGNAMPAGIVVAGEGWHPGVGGIVAGRLVERFRRPVVMVALEGATGTGSARAPKGFPLFDAVVACASELIQFGGHHAAAGLKVSASRVEALRASFNDACAKMSESREGMVVATARADVELTERDLDDSLASQLGMLEPTGASQPEPSVLVRGARLDDVREVGIGHLRAKLQLGRKQLGVFIRDGVGRRARGEIVLDGSAREVIGNLAPDSFHGPTAVQIHLTATIAG